MVDFPLNMHTKPLKAISYKPFVNIMLFVRDRFHLGCNKVNFL